MARGNFKQKRGGGRSFSKNLVLDENGTAVSTDKRATRGKNDDGDDDDDDDDHDDDDDDDDDEEEEEDEDEEESQEEGEEGTQPELSRAERRELAKKKKEAAQLKKQATGGVGDDKKEDQDDGLIANPNRAGVKNMSISDLDQPRELSRKEREAKEKKAAQEHYWKLHARGETDQARADLARLQKIRADREAAQAKRKAEAEAKAADIEKNRQSQAARGKGRD